jgi:protein-tyrosine phosphatase
MAEAYLRQRAPEWGLPDLVVESAGTLGLEGCPASPEALEAMREIGIDLTEHRSKGLDPAALDRADVVVAMEREHLRRLAALRGETGGGRWFLLRGFEGAGEPAFDAPDLPDPIGRPLTFYRSLLPGLMRCVEHLARYLKRTAPA